MSLMKTFEDEILKILDERIDFYKTQCTYKVPETYPIYYEVPEIYPIYSELINIKGMIAKAKPEEYIKYLDDTLLYKDE